MTDKRNPPWTMETVGEVIESMNRLKGEHGYNNDTPIVWYHLENHALTGQVIESHLPMNELVEITMMAQPEE